MKKIKEFFVSIIIGLIYMFGFVPSIIEAPSLYSSLTGTKWTSYMGSTLIRLYFKKDATMWIFHLDKGTEGGEHYFTIQGDTLMVTERYNSSKVYEMKIKSVTSTKLVLEGNWPFPLEYNKYSL